MIYYQVKPEYDQTRRLIWKRHKHAFFDDGIFISNELYTARELQKYYIAAPGMFNEILVPKNKIYYFFGARFKMED